jgi:hypothetical protein
MTNETTNDPLEFLKSMWGNMGFSIPGMVTPTVDTDELSKRITDLKAVEGWLKSNLSLLQMTIQGLEMQRTTLDTLQQMRQVAQNAQSGDAAANNPFLNPAVWGMPWNMMANAVPPEPTSEGDPSAASTQGEKTASTGEAGKPGR